MLGTATRREAGYPGPSTLGSSALHTDLQIRFGATLTPGSPTVQPSRAQGHARATFGLQRLCPPLPPSSPPPSLTPYSALLHATPPALVHCLLPRASPLQFPSTSVRPEVTRGASSPRAARSTPHPTIVTPSPPFFAPLQSTLLRGKQAEVPQFLWLRRHGVETAQACASKAGDQSRRRSRSRTSKSTSNPG